MRGDGRTPRGLRVQQITSRAAGGHQHLSRRTTADAHSRQDRRTKRKANRKRRCHYGQRIAKRDNGIRCATINWRDIRRRPAEPIKKRCANQPSNSPCPTSKGAFFRSSARERATEAEDKSISDLCQRARSLRKICPVMHLKGWHGYGYWRWGYSDMTLPTSTTLDFKGCNSRSI